MTYILEKRESQISIKAPWILTILERSVKDFPKRKKGILCCITSIYKIIFLQYTAINILTFFVSNENSERQNTRNELTANNFSECNGTTRSSWSAVNNMVAGYWHWLPELCSQGLRTLWRGEYLVLISAANRKKKDQDIRINSII